MATGFAHIETVVGTKGMYIAGMDRGIVVGATIVLFVQSRSNTVSFPPPPNVADAIETANVFQSPPWNIQEVAEEGNILAHNVSHT